MTSSSEMNDQLRAMVRRKAGADPEAAGTGQKGSQERPGTTDMNQALRDALNQGRRTRSTP